MEIGSGCGREALDLTNMGYEYVGIDTSQELLKIASQIASAAQFLYSTVYAMPFEKETFDAFIVD